MEKLLAGDHPSLATLRAQYDAAEVEGRDFTGVGFFTHYSVPAAVSVVSPQRFQLTDLHLELAGTAHGAGVVLFVDAGVLQTLEVYMWAEDWPAEPELTGIHYLHETAMEDRGGYHVDPVQVRDPIALARSLHVT